MEFLFALPFLFFIMILSVNFARLFLMKQRAIMAVRYAAFADVHRQPVPDSQRISSLFFPGDRAQAAEGEEQGQPAALVDGARNSDLPSNSNLSGFMNSLSSSRQYEVRLTFRPVCAAGDYWGKGENQWFPELPVSERLVMDSRDWRWDEMSYWQLIKNMFNGAFGSLGDILK